VSVVVRLARRRWFLFAVPQAALTAACALGAARGSPPAPTDTPSPLAPASRPHPTEERARPTEAAPAAAPRRVLPLPTPREDERLWLDQWLDLISLTGRGVTSGC